MIDSPIVTALLRSAALPSLVVALLFVLVGGLKEPLKTQVQALVFGLGFFAGSYLLRNQMESFAWVSVLLCGFVVIAPRQNSTRYMLRALVVLAVFGALLWPLRNSLNNSVNIRNIIAFFCLSLGVWSIVERVSNSVKTFSLVLLPLISASTLSILMVTSGSASYSQMVTILCALFGGVGAASWLWPNKISKLALVPFLSVFVISFMVAGHFYLDINPWILVFLCVPYLVLWIRNWLFFVPDDPVLEAILLGLISTLPLAYYIYGVASQPRALY